MTEQQADDTQVVSEDQDQASASTASEDQASREPQSIDDLPSWVQKEIKSLRTENAKARRERQQREEAEKSAIELAEARQQAAEDERNNYQQELRRFYFSEAIQLPNKQYAWLAAQQYGIEVEFDENNRPTNADKVAKELAKRDSKLFGAGKVDAGERNELPVQGDGPASQLYSILTNR